MKKAVIFDREKEIERLMRSGLTRKQAEELVDRYFGKIKGATEHYNLNDPFELLKWIIISAPIILGILTIVGSAFGSGKKKRRRRRTIWL